MELIAAFDRATSEEPAVTARSGPANTMPSAQDAEPFASYLTDESPADNGNAAAETAPVERDRAEKAKPEANEKAARDTEKEPNTVKERETESSDETEEPEPMAMVQESETTPDAPKEQTTLPDIAQQGESSEATPSEENAPERHAGNKDVASVKSDGEQNVTEKPSVPAAHEILPDAEKSAEAAKSLQNAKKSGAEAMPASDTPDRVELPASDAAKGDAKLPGNPAEVLQPGRRAAGEMETQPEGNADVLRLNAKEAERDSVAQAAEELRRAGPEPARPETNDIPRTSPAFERLIQTVERPVHTTTETSNDSFAVRNSDDGASLLYARSQPTQETAATLRTQGAQQPARLNESDLIASIVRQGRLLTRPNGSSEMRISLRPPELGGVLVRLTMENDQLRAELQVENPAVRQALDSLQQRLRATLAEEGITLQQFEVDVRQDRPFGGHGGPEDEAPDAHFTSPTPESIRKASETSSTVGSRVLSASRDDAGAMDYLA